MIAIGCLAPMILGVIGGLMGHWLAGYPGIPWGLGIGFGIGSIGLGAAAWLVARMKA
tara:strand:- start:625 stop:795 length:171 start_codon:yes stop_codon:yes gene_type:complete